MTPITVWERWVGERRNQRLEHNHIEDGHSDDAKPAAISPEQAAAWRGAQWVSSHAYLIDGVVTMFVGGMWIPPQKDWPAAADGA